MVTWEKRLRLPAWLIKEWCFGSKYSLLLFWTHRQRGLFIECFPKIKGNGHRTWPFPPFISAHFPIRNQNIEKSSLNTLFGSWLIVLYHDSGQDIILHQACLPSKARNSLSVNLQPSIRLSWTRITKTNRRLFSGNHEIHGNPRDCRELCQDLQQKATFVQSAPTEQQQQGSSVPQWEVHAKSANTLTQTPSSMSPFAVTMTVLKKNFLVLWLQHFGHAKVLCKMVNTSGKGKRRKDWTERWENIANKVGAWPIVDTKNMSVYTISSFTIPATPASTYVRCVVPLCSACKSHHVSGRIWSFVRIHSDVWMYSSPCKDELEKWCFGKRLPKYGFNMARFSVFLHKSRIFEPTSKPRPNPLERSSSATKHSTAPNE